MVSDQDNRVVVVGGEMNSRLSLKIDDFGIDIRNALIAMGYDYINPPIIQDAEHFIELSGENIRRRLFIVTDNEENKELCLRPEFTIPIIKEYRDSSFIHTDKTQKYCYSGNVFRVRKAENGNMEQSEIAQAGVEIFSPKGDSDIEQECLESILEILESKGLQSVDILIGDYSIFNEIIKKLKISNFWKSRIKRRFFHKRKFVSENDFISNYDIEVNELIKSIHGKSEKEAVLAVEELLAASNIPSFGSRSIKDIAVRLLSKADSIYGERPADDLISLLSQYQNIEGKLDDVLFKLAQLCDKLNINIDEKLDDVRSQYSKIIGNIDKAHNYSFTSFFDSKFEYYSGFIFNISANSNGQSHQLAQGGRYDRLLGKLQIGDNIAAVGGSIYIDNLIEALGDNL